jgi:5-methylcytosine-specific restriction endonuclease McrA
MQKFNRTPAPLSWEEKHSQGMLSSLYEMTQGHCSFCNSCLLQDGASYFVNFLSIDPFYGLSSEWNNLYPSCAICSSAKANQYDAKLLRPDAPDYDFDRYFSIEWGSGYLLPNETASLSSQ